MTAVVDREIFKAALRRWASGVTIVTTRVGERRAGMTASAFSSVSLDPPLVLVCPDEKANTLPLLLESGVFAVQILAAGQRELSDRFAKAGNEETRFDGLVCSSGKSGAPWLPGALAVLDCRLVACHRAGDHRICVGEVIDAQVDEDGAPLLYFAARYGAVESRARP